MNWYVRDFDIIGYTTKHDQVATIATALKANPELKVSILTDSLRGTREAPEKPSCASLLALLLRDFGPERVEIRMFHTPNLIGWRKAILPKRINEGWGLQHMKLYGIDDEVIISGANLSSDYFSDRQDRYQLFKSRGITDYFQKVHSTACGLSYALELSGDVNENTGFKLKWPTNNLASSSPTEDPRGYIAAATRSFASILRPRGQALSAERNGRSDTQVYPLLQLTSILDPDTSTELPALTGILDRLGKDSALAGSKWTFTAGYFNMRPDFRKLLLDSARNGVTGTVVAASPWANGFYGSKGISGMLPSAYTYLARRFLDAVNSAGLSEHISVKEWRRGTVSTPGGWTYHAKGIWVTLPGRDGKASEGPSICLVGSSNYTTRSYSLDLEANALIVTTNPDLQERLGKEERHLQDYAATMTRDDYTRTERRVGLHVRVAMWITTLIGGAL